MNGRTDGPEPTRPGGGGTARVGLAGESASSGGRVEPQLRFGSLFSGIGGLDHGLARAGFRHQFFCESDPWRRQVLAQHWPGVPIYADVQDVARDGDACADERGPRRERGRNRTRNTVDLLGGGFPCQDLSVAGQRRGLAGERSGLFHEFARIIDTIRPRWVLLENVPGLLSSNGGRDFGVVLGTLADLGYGVAWRILDSRFFGVPQRRRRVFIVGTVVVGDPRAAAERAGAVLAVGTRCDRHPPTGGAAGPDVAFALADSSGNRTGSGRDGQDTFVSAFSENQQEGASVRRLTPRECERLQGLPDDWTAYGPDSRRYAALGDAVTASVGYWLGQRIVAAC